MVTVLKACTSTRAVHRHPWRMQQRHHSRQALSIAPSRLKSGEGPLPGGPMCALQFYIKVLRLLSWLSEPCCPPLVPGNSIAISSAASSHAQVQRLLCCLLSWAALVVRQQVAQSLINEVFLDAQPAVRSNGKLGQATSMKVWG